MSISYKELKEAVKALNNTEIEELETLRSVGVKRAILEQQFIEQVEKVARYISPKFGASRRNCCGSTKPAGRLKRWPRIMKMICRI